MAISTNVMRFTLASVLTAVAAFAFVAVDARPAAAATICESECGGPTPTPAPSYSPSPTPTYSPSPSPSPYPSSSPSPYPSSSPSPTPTPTGADSSGGSIGDLANQRFNQMITNRVLGTVLLGVNEQVNCSNCVSAFGSAGSFSAGIHGRKELTNNLSLLAGIAYTQYSEGGYNITSAPIGAFALRYDFTDWGSSRPFFDVGTILTPWEKARYTRSYNTSLGPVSVTSSTNAANYAVYGRAGWISRVSPRDEVAASVEIWQLWQRVKGYTDQTVVFNPFDATFNSGTDKTSLVKIGAQWTHLITNSVEGNINGGYVYAFGSQSGVVAAVTGQGMVTPTIGNQGWFEYGGRLGFPISKRWGAALFLQRTLR